jgi:peptidoglycan hydrolase CwlO-like protein
MRVLNKRERTSAFLWFLLFFVITVGLFILAIFFNFQVPARENVALRKQLSTFRQEQAFQADFLQKLEKVRNNLDSINLPNQNANYIDQVIPKDAVSHYGLYANIIQNCLLLQQSKQQLRGLQNAQQTIAELKEKIADINKELENARSELDYNRQIMRSR